MSRNFRCEFTDNLCDDPRCKVGYCVPARETRLEVTRVNMGRHEYAPARDQRALAKAARQVARDFLRAKHRKPTEDPIARMLGLPAVLAEAQRRLEFLSDSK